MNLPTETGCRGGTDIFLIRFDHDGAMLDSWHFGGSNTEFMWDLQTDAFGGLYMAARSTSSGGMSLASGLSITASPFLARLAVLRPPTVSSMGTPIMPTVSPLALPTFEPSAAPFASSLVSPSASPSFSPTALPTSSPSEARSVD